MKIKMNINFKSNYSKILQPYFVHELLSIEHQNFISLIDHQATFTLIVRVIKRKIE